MTRLAEGLCFNALLKLKVENSLICLVRTRITTESKMEGQFILPLKTFIRKKSIQMSSSGMKCSKIKKKINIEL
jgi:hypothetical protein